MKLTGETPHFRLKMIQQYREAQRHTNYVMVQFSELKHTPIS